MKYIYKKNVLVVLVLVLGSCTSSKVYDFKKKIEIQNPRISSESKVINNMRKKAYQSYLNSEKNGGETCILEWALFSQGNPKATYSIFIYNMENDSFLKFDKSDSRFVENGWDNPELKSTVAFISNCLDREQEFELLEASKNPKYDVISGAGFYYVSFFDENKNLLKSLELNQFVITGFTQ
ncbi:hypothetical protein [Croceivirga radicis]|uniref:hypothetical protein n=1 Tax=Croceivirga radicis TaxID=1929488 RepID=UPI000255B312|nr:hypothetical protein [Croceivirga radicis]